MSFIKERRPALSTAHFQPANRVSVSRRNDDRNVRGYLWHDSAGGREQTNYSCTVRADSGGRWHLVELQLYKNPR